MIIDDEKVDKALDYLGASPHPAAKARHMLRTAEIARDKLFASLFLKAEGSVKERESKATVDLQYTAACKAAIDAEMTFENEKARCKAAELIIDLFRTEQANARAMERIR